MSNIRNSADRRFQEALARSGARDPRSYYRERLRDLRQRRPDAYRRAVEYYEGQLIPRVADDSSDPLTEWLEYGHLLATLTTDGETVQVDPTGRSRPYSPPVPLNHLVLHLPSSRREAALPIGLPPELSGAQRATFDLLVTRMSR